MSINPKVKFAVCVGFLTFLAVVIGMLFQHSINERFALFCWGGPLYVYLNLARAFHAGEAFNFVLIFVVFAGYLALLLSPLYFIFRSFKWPFVFAQIGLIIVHFMIGWALIA
ncbi:MAG: hypothetical protein V3V90_08935 [Thermodesulfobacteriota bacterium]